MAPPVTRYHGQLSSRTISKKTDDPILRKLSDGRTDGQTDRRRDRQTDESDFIGGCPNNVERPIEKGHGECNQSFYVPNQSAGRVR